MRIAAVDIGTVTIRLLVADVDEREISEVGRSTDIVHLGQDLARTGVLDARGMDAAIDALARYAGVMSDLRVDRYAAYATSASRDASNSAEFLARARRAGIDIEVIPGGHEAELAFAGATYGRTGTGLLVVDCGGGSTEFVLGDVDARDGAAITASRSVDVGSRRLTDLFFQSDPPLPAEIEAARAWAAEQIASYFNLSSGRPSEMIALAGTATTLAAIDAGMADYDPDRVHGHVVSGARLADMFDHLASLTLEERKAVVGLHAGRASVIVAGALILETALAFAGLDSFTVSEHDILYGILLDVYRGAHEARG